MIPMTALNEKGNNQSAADVKTGLQIEAEKIPLHDEAVEPPKENNGEEETKHVIASGDDNDTEDTDVDNLIHRS